MNFRFFLLPLLALLFAFSPASGQTLIARGGFVAEVMLVVDAGRLYVSYKGSDTVVVPRKASPGAVYDVVDLSPRATGVRFDFGYFATYAFALSPEGKILWRKKYGRSGSSRPSGIAADRQGGVLVAAPSPDRKDEVVVDRIDGEGTILWRTRIDSLTDAPRVVVTDQPYLTLLGWDEKTQYLLSTDSTLSANTLYNASTIRLEIESGKPFGLGEYGARTSEGTLGTLVSAGFAYPVSSRHMDWLTWRGDSLVLYAKQTEQDGAFVLPLPEKTGAMTIRKGVFRDSTYVAVGTRRESDDVLITSVRYGSKTAGRELVRELERLKGMRIINLSFNEDGGVTVAAAAGTQVRIVELDAGLEPLREVVYTINAGDEEGVAVAAVEAAEGEGYHIIYVTEGADEHRMWHVRIE